MHVLLTGSKGVGDIFKHVTTNELIVILLYM